MAQKTRQRLQALDARRRKLFDRFASLIDMVDGNLVQIFRRCGKPACKCVKGQKHGPAWAVLYKDKGRSKMIYVPADSLTAGLKECRRRLKMYTHFKQTYRKVLAVNREILKLELTDKKGGRRK